MCKPVPIAFNQIRILRVFFLKLLLHFKRLCRISEYFIIKHLIGNVILLMKNLIRRIHDDNNTILFDDGFVIEPVENIAQDVAYYQHRVDTCINGIRTHIGQSKHQRAELAWNVYRQLLLH